MKWKSELMARDSYGYGKFFDGNSSGQLLAYDLIMQEIKGICSSGWTFRHYTKLFLSFIGGWRPSSEQSTSYHSNSIFYFYFLPSWLVKLFIHKKKKNKHETWSRFCLYRNLNLIKLMMLNLQIKRGK